MNKNLKIKLVKEVPFWWHTIDLGDGVVTPGQIPSFVQQIRLDSIPTNLKGKKVLDIGCWDGFFSFECEKRGGIVKAIDNLQYEKFVKYRYKIKLNGNLGFQIVKKILNSKVEYKMMDFFDIKDETFNIVLFFGLLYHMKNPLSAIEHLFNLTEELLIIESHYIPDNSGIPYMIFYPEDELNQDPTNWWGPTLLCIQKMCETAGFLKVELFKRYYYNNDHRVIFRCYK